MLTQYWLARQCAISVPHSSMSAGEMGTAPLSLGSGDAAPTPRAHPGLHSPMQRCSCSTQPLLQRRQLESSGPVQRPHAW